MNDEGFVLCRTARGVAMRCGCCRQVEITFGNAVLSLDPPELDSLLEVIDTFDLDRAEARSPAERCFLIRTERDQAAFAFSRDEALELRELIHGARASVRGVQARPRLALPGLPDPTTLN